MQIGIFNDDIIEQRGQSANLKTWGKYNCFTHRAHQEQKRAVTTAGKGGYIATVKKIYGAPPPSLEDHHEVIEDIQTIVQVMKTQGYELEGLVKFKAVLARSNSAVMAQLDQMNETMNSIQAQLKNTCLSTNQPSDTKKKVLLLDLQEKFYSREQNLIIKERRTPRGIVPQENNGRK